MIELLFEAVADRWSRRTVLARLERLQAGGILLGSVRAVEGTLGRLGDQWLSSEWHVSSGRIHLGSTTIRVASVDAGSRSGNSGDFLLPAGLDAVVLTVRGPGPGPGPVVEVAMCAQSEAWFRERVAPLA